MSTPPGEGPHRLSIIGYWSRPDVPADRLRGYPDPRDLCGGWDPDAREAVVDALVGGRFLRQFSGRADCRICDRTLGGGERTDGVWAWPEGLEHYVQEHDVRLPEAFVAHCRSGSTLPGWVRGLEVENWVEGGHNTMVPVIPREVSTWIIDDAPWLDWAAANTPARPAEDAIGLDEARALCARLSHPAWSARIEECAGRWRLDVGREGLWDRLYLERSSASVLERQLLRLRSADPTRLLTPEAAREIAASFDGPWGAARMVATNGQAWLVCVKPPQVPWPENEDIQKVCAGGIRPGWTMLSSGGVRYFMVPLVDEIGWRWVLECERRTAMEQAQDPEAAGGG